MIVYHFDLEIKSQSNYIYYINCLYIIENDSELTRMWTSTGKNNNDSTYSEFNDFDGNYDELAILCYQL